jgi:glycosyltransferase involved in cell wall biosynthesis
VRLPAAVRGVVSAARRLDAHVIEGCGEKMSLLAGWAARGVGCTCVHNLQDPPRRDTESAIVQLGALAGRRDAIVVPSRWMARAFRRAWRVRPDVIPNSVIVEELPARGSDVRRLAGWPRDSLVVGLFGRLVAWKGVEVLLQAAARLADSNHSIRFLVAGGTLYGWEPEYRRRLGELTRELGVAERVHFTGHREDALGLMAGCDAVCHCALAPEPFGMVVLEAMALAKPVIASRTGGPEELIEHGRTGILVAPGDDRTLANEISALARSAERRRELGVAARSVVHRDFASAAVGPALNQLYRRVSNRMI